MLSMKCVITDTERVSTLQLARLLINIRLAHDGGGDVDRDDSANNDDWSGAKNGRGDFDKDDEDDDSSDGNNVNDKGGDDRDTGDGNDGDSGDGKNNSVGSVNGELK